MPDLNILLIEDDLIIATELQAELEDAGHHVIGIARNSAEAMKLIKTVPPDIALIDITLAGIEDGGIRIAHEILDQHWMPFIYLTAHSDMAIVEKASKTAPAAYMFKPYRIAELLVQIKLAYENAERNVPALPFHAYNMGDSFYFPNKNGHERVLSNNILGMKAQGYCTELFLANESKSRIVGTHLGHLATYFQTENFLRLSKSLIINLNHLVQVERTQVFLGSEKLRIEITEANRKELMKRLKVIRTK